MTTTTTTEFHNPDFPEECVNVGSFDARNLVDFYKFWETDAIKAHLAAKATPSICVVENYSYDFLWLPLLETPTHSELAMSTQLVERNGESRVVSVRITTHL